MRALWFVLLFLVGGLAHGPRDPVGCQTIVSRQAPGLKRRNRGRKCSTEGAIVVRTAPAVLARMLGVVALAAAVGACGSLPPARERPTNNAAAMDPSSALAKIVMASTPPDGHSGVRLMPLGIHSLDARLELARRAEHSLVVQYYDFETDGAGTMIMRALRDAAVRGVKVRILVDDLFTANSQHVLQTLSHIPNVEVSLYNPFCCARDGLISRFAASPHEIRRLNHRMHNKLFIADGAMAILGGRNIADQYFELNQAQNFVDLDALAVGRIVPELEGVFDSFWNSDQVRPIGEVLGDDSLRMSAQEFDDWLGMSPAPPDIRLPLLDLLGHGPIKDELDSGRIGFVWGVAHAIADPPSKPHTMSETEAIAASVTMTIWRLIRGAEHEVVVSSPYLVPGDRGMQIIDGLAMRGVSLTLLTNSLAANDVPLVHTAYRRYRKMLLNSRVNLYELSPGRTTANRRIGAFGMSLSRLHAKMVAIDGDVVFIGSMNLDPRSATQNTEMGILMNSHALTQEVLRIIEVSKTQNSYRLRLSASSGDLEWLAKDGDLEVIFRNEPETGPFQRFYLNLIAPFIPESLL